MGKFGLPHWVWLMMCHISSFTPSEVKIFALFQHGKGVEKTMKNTNQTSLEDIRAMHKRGEVSAPKSDAPAIDMPEGFWDAAKPQAPKTKKQVNMRVDPDILEFFQEQGKGHLTRMHAVLRSYVDAHKKGPNPS
jgi:uncharacterized protein (DUF4415 family)